MITSDIDESSLLGDYGNETRSLDPVDLKYSARFQTPDSKLGRGSQANDKTSENKVLEFIEFGKDPIQYILGIIAKEVKSDDKLTRQVLYTILSSATKNPINLAVNAPSGEGKSYVVNKVASLFSDQVVISLAGMTEKALFHRKGVVAVKENGEYVPLRIHS